MFIFESPGPPPAVQTTLGLTQHSWPGGLPVLLPVAGLLLGLEPGRGSLVGSAPTQTQIEIMCIQTPIPMKLGCFVK